MRKTVFAVSLAALALTFVGNAEARTWTAQSPFTVRHNGFFFHKVKVTGPGYGSCQITITVMFKSPSRRPAKIQAIVMFKSGAWVRTLAFNNAKAGNRQVVHRTDTKGHGCWGRKRQVLKTLIVNTCFGRNCTVQTHVPGATKTVAKPAGKYFWGLYLGMPTKQVIAAMKRQRIEVDRPAAAIDDSYDFSPTKIYGFMGTSATVHFTGRRLTKATMESHDFRSRSKALATVASMKSRITRAVGRRPVTEKTGSGGFILRWKIGGTLLSIMYGKSGRRQWKFGFFLTKPGYRH